MAEQADPHGEVQDFDPLHPTWVQNPYPYLRRLQQDDPVHWSEKYEFWVLTRYADYPHTVDDPRYSRSRTVWNKFQPPSSEQRDSKLSHFFAKALPQLSGDEHTRIRALTRNAFTPRAIRSLDPMIEGLAKELVGRFEGRAVVDVKAELADPLPLTVMARMVGIPAESQLEERFKELADKVALVTDAKRFKAEFREIDAAVEELSENFTELIEEKRRKPGDDILSFLVAKHDDGDSLTTHELNSLLVLLIVAGAETTTNVLTHGVRELSKHPDAIEQLAAQPERWDAAIEEVQRLQHALWGSLRYLTDNIEIRGKQLAKGDCVFMCRTAMFRDPELFEDPEAFRIERPQPERSQVFGLGEHFCIGSHLARAELRSVFSSLFGRYPKLRLASDTLDYDLQVTVRSLRSLEIQLEP